MRYYFQYDDLNRLVHAETERNSGGSDGEWDFAYHANGSIDEMKRHGQTFDYVYNAGKNQLDKLTHTGSTPPRNASATDNFQYDADGRMISDASKRLTVTYDETLDRPYKFLVKDGSGNPVKAYYMVYDASGDRVSKLEYTTDATWAKSNHYFGTGEEYRELTGAGPVLVYAMDGFGRVAREGGDGPWTLETYVKNHLGSTVRVVNSDGSYATTPVFDYQPYGELQGIREDSANPVSAKFTGKELDTTVDLSYFGARWYDAELGMWIGPDPAQEGFNPYGYVGGNPIMFVDPYGLFKLGVGLVVGWNRRDGWSLGVGVAANDINLGVAELNTDVSHSWNQNGSQTSTIQVGGSACVGLCLGGTAGGSYNTEAGYSANLSGNVGVGITNYLQVGVEAGTNHYWTTGGDYIGGDVYGGGYAQAGARVSAGYSYGIGAIESGFYARASLLGTTAGYHSAQGWNTGFSHRVGVANYDSKGGWSVDNDAKILGGAFAVNTESGVLGAAGQLASRFTWELPQTVLGVGVNYALNKAGLVSGVSYHKGRTFVNSSGLPGAFTLGSFVGGAYTGLEKHEYGHTIQSQAYGPAYLLAIASPSLLSATFSSLDNHNGRWYEQQATRWGAQAY